MSENLTDAKELAVQISGMVADAVMSKLAAIGLTEINIRKPATAGRGTPSLAAGEGSRAVKTPVHLDDHPGNVEFPASSFLEDPFDSSASCDTLPRLSSKKRKRDVTPEVIAQEEAMFLQPRKSSRHNEVDREEDKFLMENDKGQADRLPVSHSSPPASKPLGYALEDTLVENIQQRDQDEDDLLRGNIRSAIQKLLKNPTAREKSKAQMEALLLIMRKRQDGLITMRTGGGKSMLWLIPPLLDPETRFVVVCPFTVLLNQQCELAQRHGLRATKYGVGDIPRDVQILFVQVEHVGCQKFSKWAPLIDCYSRHRKD